MWRCVIIIILSLSQFVALGASQDSLPSQYTGYWSYENLQHAEIHLDKTYFKYRYFDSRFSRIGRYHSCQEHDWGIQVTGIFMNDTIRFNLSLSNDTLTLVRHIRGEFTLKPVHLRRVERPDLEPVQVEKNMFPGMIGEELFIKQWVRAYARDLVIMPEVCLWNGRMWNIVAKTHNKSKLRLLVQSTSSGKYENLEIHKLDGGYKIIDANAQHTQYCSETYRVTSAEKIGFWPKPDGRYIIFSPGNSSLNRMGGPYGMVLHAHDDLLHLDGVDWKLRYIQASADDPACYYQYGQEWLKLRNMPVLGQYALNVGVRDSGTTFMLVSPWFFVIIFSVIILCISPLWFFYRLSRRKYQMNKLKLSVLRAQLNPHFVFNAMNSIQNLVNKNEVESTNLFLTDFSRLMRNVLLHSSESFVPLIEEIENIQRYCRLEALRQSFSYEVYVDPKIYRGQAEISPGLIQPIVENAIQHALPYTAEPSLVVQFTMDHSDLLVFIVDNGPGIIVSKNRKGKGLDLVIDRIRLLNKTHFRKKIRFNIELRDAQEEGTMAKFVFKRVFR